MKKTVYELKLKGRDEIDQCSKNNDITNFAGFVAFKKEIKPIQKVFDQEIGNVFSEYYNKISNEIEAELLRESFAEKDTRIKPHKYVYSVKFNFYECLNKKELIMGFVADKGDILAELVVNIEFI